MSLSKHKSHNYTAVQMVCWLSSGSIKPCQMHALVRIVLEAILPFFLTFSLQTDIRKVCSHVFEMYRLLLNNLRLKLGQNNIEVSFRHYSSVYIYCSKQWILFQQPTNTLSKSANNFFYVGCGCLLVKRTKSNFCLHSKPQCH